jgi:hypothetical protein
VPATSRYNCLSLRIALSKVLVYNVFIGKKNHKEQTAKRNIHANEAPYSAQYIGGKTNERRKNQGFAGG